MSWLSKKENYQTLQKVDNMQECIYECMKCKNLFNSTELQLEKMPENMHISTPGVDVEDGIPKCPHCGYLAFFGFKVVDIAF